MTERSMRTTIGEADEDSITIRGRSLTDDVVGEMDFGSFVYLHLRGEEPTDAEAAMTNALLCTLVEHGMTPSAIAARLTHGSAPDALQGAVASGLLGVGSRFLGSMEDCAELLQDAAPYRDVADAADEAIAAADGRFPGLGHDLHVDGDPRADRLFALADEHGVEGPHVPLLMAVRDELERRHDSTLPVNATGAIAAVASDMGFDWRVTKIFPIVGRAAGLVGHVAEEMEEPMAGDIWDIVDDEVTYEGD